MSNPYGRQGKAGFVVSTLAIPAFGIVLIYFKRAQWGIPILILGIIFFFLSIWLAYGRK